MNTHYRERLKKFRERLTTVHLIFLPLSADLQYLTGIPRDFPNFGAVLHPGAWLEGMWFTPHHEPVYTLSRMTAEFSGKSDIIGGDVRILGDRDDPFALVKAILDGFKLPDRPTVAVSERALGETLIALQTLLPDIRLQSATELLRPMRAVKSEDEIGIMRQAGHITESAFADVILNLKHGMTELDVISEVDYRLKKHGAAGPSFTTAMYNTGPQYPLIHGHPETKWHRKLEPPVSLLFDFGAIYQGYCYDFGRTVVFGEPTSAQLEVHRLVMVSQKAGIEELQAGTSTAAQADAAARTVIQDAGHGAAFRHRLGHGIGLDVHEPPFLTAGDNTVLQERMLFTVEPSILYPDRFSARVEDVVVARADGGEALTNGFQELIVID